MDKCASALGMMDEGSGSDLTLCTWWGTWLVCVCACMHTYVYIKRKYKFKYVCVCGHAGI